MRETGCPLEWVRGTLVRGDALQVAPLAVVHPPDLVVDLLSGKERGEFAFVVSSRGVEHLADDPRGRAVDPETADSAGHVPVDRSSKPAPWRSGALLDVCNPLGESHPQTVAEVRTRRDQTTW